MKKMLRLYYFTPAKWGMQNLVKRRLKIARIMELNDPFEFVGCDLRDQGWRAAMRDHKKMMDRHHGLLCFSRTWRDPVQWSHYADHHRGLCLGFDVDIDTVRQVSYVRSRIPVHPDAYTNPQSDQGREFLTSIMYTKFAHWSYEDEFRCYTALNDWEMSEDGSQKLYFSDFGDSLALREVIVGPQCDVTPIQLYEVLYDYPMFVRVTKARAAFKSFRVVEQKSPERWLYPPESV